MPESKTHKKAKSRAAGTRGKKEVKLKSGERIDVITKTKAIEIELSGNFKAAAKRLKKSHKNIKILQVRQKDMKKAVADAKKVGYKGTVSNLKSSKYIRVK